MLLRATSRSRRTALAIPGSRVRRFRLRSSTCDSYNDLLTHHFSDNSVLLTHHFSDNSVTALPLCSDISKKTGPRLREFVSRIKNVVSHNLGPSFLTISVCTCLDVSQKVVVNVLHPSERVVRQVEGVELIQLVVIRNVELKSKENTTYGMCHQ